jgi:hypothetical protein
MISMAPDWTPATSRYASLSPQMRTDRDATSRDFGSISGWLPVVSTVQKCSGSVAETRTAKPSILLIVCHLIALSTGSMAYGLLIWPNVDEY